MVKYVDKSEWVEEVLMPDESTPILGGMPEWDSTNMLSGYSNVPVSQLADRTRFLHDRIQELELDVEQGDAGSLKRDNNLSDLQDIGQAKYYLDLNLVDNTRDLDKPISDATQDALDTKVDKVVGKQLSTNDYTTPEKNKLAGIESGAQVNVATNLGVGTRTSTNVVVTSSTGSSATLPVATTALAGTMSSADKTKLDGIATGATANATNAQLRDRATHTGEQAISTITGLQTALDGKTSTTTSIVAGNGLTGGGNLSASRTVTLGTPSTVTGTTSNEVTATSHTHAISVSVADVSGLNTALNNKVDKVTGMGLSQESFTTSEKSKLAGLESSKFKGEFTSLTALQSAFPTAPVGSYAYVDQGAGQDVVKYIWDTTDTRWVLQQGESAALTPADVKSLYEANANTNAFTDTEKTKLSGIQAGAQVNVGTNLAMGGSGNSRTITSSTGNNVSVPVATTSAAGFMSTTDKSKLDGLDNVNIIAGSNVSLSGAYPNITISSTNTTYAEITTAEIDAGTASTLRTITGRRMKYALDKKADTVHGHTISDVTGLQAAIDSKANTSTQVIAGTGLSGGGTLAANRTLSVTYGTTAGTAAQGNDSRLSDSREWTAAVVSQSEAEAGVATTARKWTAQRVRQAITGWWNSISVPTSKLTGTISDSLLPSTMSPKTITGMLTVTSSTGSVGIEVGRTDSVASTPYIDFHSGATPTDYDARIIASGGNGTSAQGSLSYTAAGGHTFTGTINGNGSGITNLNAGNLSTGIIPADRLPSSIPGNAATATKLSTSRTIGMTGDVTWTSAAFDGSGNVTGTATLANSGVTAGTYTKVTVDAKGRVTAGSAMVASDVPALNASKAQVLSGTNNVYVSGGSYLNVISWNNIGSISANTSINLDTSLNHSLTATASLTLDAINVDPGKTGDIIISTPSAVTISWAAKWKFLGSVPNIGGAGETWVVSYKVFDANTIYASAVKVA